MDGRIAVFAAWLCCAAALQAGWQMLEGCRLKESKWNDGDSFHVAWRGKEFIFRLCYVDTPETKAHKGLTARTTAQARYWKIRKSDMFPVAAEAANYTAGLLAGGFAVKTQWEDARGESASPRYFAVITTPQGDLAELLVAHGYARIYGYSPASPTGIPAERVIARLKAVEQKARDKSLGAWAFSRKPADPKVKRKAPAS